LNLVKDRQALLFVNHFARPDSDFAALSHRDAKKQKNFMNLARGRVAHLASNRRADKRSVIRHLYAPQFKPPAPTPSPSTVIARSAATKQSRTELSTPPKQRRSPPQPFIVMPAQAGIHDFSPPHVQQPHTSIKKVFFSKKNYFYCPSL
jgi:hypothetical protein